MARRTLAIRPGGIGDCILSFPAIEWLRNSCDYLEVWTPTVVCPLVTFADAVSSIASTGLDRLAVYDPPQSLFDRLKSFDRIVSWYGSGREEFRAEVVALPFEFHQALPGADCGVHAVEFFCGQVGAPVSAPRIPVDIVRADYGAIHPFSGGLKKNWPLQRFRETAALLGMPVEWCAGPEEALDDARRFESLMEVARWLAAARVYLGNDSGITHLAAAVGTPVVSIFQASDALVWAPRGERIIVLPGSSTPETVAEAARSLC